MILTCPQCATRFLLPAASLGEEGRHVKCSNCAEVWHQMPDDDELGKGRITTTPGDEGEQDIDQTGAGREAGGLVFDDIPDGVKPVPEGSGMPALPEDIAPRSFKERLSGIITVATLSAILILIALLGLNKPISAAFPQSAALYKIFGIEVAIPGEGLVFDRISVSAQATPNGERFAVEGMVINLTAQQQELPFIEVQLKGLGDETVEQWVFALPIEVIEEEGVQPFKSSYDLDGSNGKAQSAQLRFVLRPGKAAPEKDDTQRAAGDAANSTDAQQAGEGHEGDGHGADKHSDGGH